MDDIDQAQQNEEIYRQSALNRHFGRTGRGARGTAPVSGREARTCAGCGDEIDGARLEANPHAVRCLDCQERHERRTRLGLV